MSSPRLLICIGLLLCALAPAAHALRCGTRLVTKGATDFQVRERCGNPYWIEAHYQVLVAGDERVEVAEPVEYSAWYFNFGSNRLLVRLLFRDGRHVREDALGRGVEYQDMPLVRSIARDVAQQDNRFSAIVLAIVGSAPFQSNTKKE